MTMHSSSHPANGGYSANGMPLAETANEDTPDLAGLSSGAGATLRAARERKGIAVETAAQALKIKPAHLVALENNRFQDLPCATYASGFLRSYAGYLGIDRQEIMRQYQARMNGRHIAPHLEMPQPLAEGRLPGLLTLGSAILGMVVIVSLWQWYAHPATVANDTTPPPPNLAAPYIAPAAHGAQNAPATNANPQSPPAATTSVVQPATTSATMANVGSAQPTPVPANKTPQTGTIYGTPDSNAHVVLHATSDLWIQITDTKNNLLFSQLLKKGDSYIVPPRDDLELTTGNAGGLSFTVDGELTQPAGATGEVLRNAPLDGTRQR